MTPREFNELPDDALLRLPDVLSVVGVGRSTWFAGVKEGRYPQPVQLSARLRAWRVRDIRKLLASL